MSTSTKSHIVVVLDVNSIPRESPFPSQNTGIKLEEDVKPDIRNVTPNSPTPYNYELVKSIKEMVVALLCKEALERQTDRFDFSRVYWSFKLYNSSVEINSKTGRTFHPVDIESIDLFEKQLESFLDCRSQSALKSDKDVNKIQFLCTSLKSVLGDLPWPEPTNDYEDEQSLGAVNRNVIHALFRVPRTDNEVQAFIPNWTSANGSKTIMNELLPKAFCRKMKELQIQLNFMDMWSAYKNHEVQSWDGEMASRPMVKIVHYLSGGTIVPFSQVSLGVPFGLPSYAVLLKLLISNATQSTSNAITDTKSRTVLDDTQKTIRKLHDSINGSTKISPQDTDVESVRSSIRIAHCSQALAMAKHNRRSLPQSAMVRANPEDTWYNANTGSNFRRYSDDREVIHRHKMLAAQEGMTKKRKYEFEEDMMSEEGYSPMEIENWCMKGKVDIKERPQPQSMRRVATQNREKIQSNKYSKNLNGKYTSPQLFQPQKRIRRENEEIMAPPSRMHISQQRHSEPRNNRNSASKSKLVNSAVRSRGRVMVNEGLNCLKKKVKSKDDNDKDETIFVNHYKETLLKQKEIALNSIMNRLQMVLKQPRTLDEIVQDDPIQELVKKVKLFTEMIIMEPDGCLPSTAQAFVSQVGKRLNELEVRDLRKAMEKILFVPYETLNLSVIRLKNSENEDAAFRNCYLQILIKFELFWVVPESDKRESQEKFVEEVIKILNLVTAYRKDPPVADFINDSLIPLYAPTHLKLLREITSAMNIPACALLSNFVESPGSGSNFQDDDCSLSSVSSSQCGPDDSTSQHPHDSSYNNLNHSQNSQRTSLRTASFLSVNNPKRAIMLASVKLPITKPKMCQKSQSQSTQSGSVRPTTKSPKPKKVRRNLFDVQTSRDPKDMKMLLNLATNAASSFSRSPSLFKSPMSKVHSSPRSPARISPFFALARAGRGRGRSRRKLNLEDDESPIPPRMGELSKWGRLDGSPDQAAGVICPESPVTPKSNSKMHSIPGSAHSSLNTSGKSIVVESPEVTQSQVSASGSANRPLNRRVDSVSFYSSGAESLKARAWERSGAKLMAARIKDSFDISTSLTLNDLEFVKSKSTSPNQNSGEGSNSASKTGNLGNGFSPEPCSSQSLNSHNLSTSMDSSNPNIQALICSEIFPSSTDILNASSSLPGKSPMLDTPSKRVSFNLDIVTTPSPRAGMGGTPKSILKDAGSTPT